MITNELYHHGILGMKWGERNGPPYPLSRSQRSSAEKRAEKLDSSSKKSRFPATEAYARRDRMTTQEIEDLARRLRAESNLKALSDKELLRGWNFIDSIFKKLNTVNTWIATSKTSYGNGRVIVEYLSKYFVKET